MTLRPVTLWSDPVRRFDGTPETIERWVMAERWELLFNLLSLEGRPIGTA